jgi:hypothetical protein
VVSTQTLEEVDDELSRKFYETVPLVPPPGILRAVKGDKRSGSLVDSDFWAQLFN